MPHLQLVSLLVADQDEAIAFFTGTLGFELVEDSPATTTDGRPKRWVVVRPRGAATGVLLARADGPEQEALVGRQFAGRVGLFLEVEDVRAEVERLRAAGVRFERPVTEHEYGTVAVFVDVAGNLWDLIEPRRSSLDPGSVLDDAGAPAAPPSGTPLSEIARQADVFADVEAALVDRESGVVWTVDRAILALLEDPDLTPEDAAEMVYDDLAGDVELDPGAITAARECWDSGDWVELPDERDLDEQRVMAAFAEEQRPAVRDRLAEVLYKRGAYRRFKDRCAEHGLLDAYHRIKDAAFADMLARFLVAHDEPFTDDRAG